MPTPLVRFSGLVCASARRIALAAPEIGPHQAWADRTAPQILAQLGGGPDAALPEELSRAQTNALGAWMARELDGFARQDVERIVLAQHGGAFWRDKDAQGAPLEARLAFDEVGSPILQQRQGGAWKKSTGALSAELERLGNLAADSIFSASKAIGQLTGPWISQRARELEAQNKLTPAMDQATNALINAFQEWRRGAPKRCAMMVAERAASLSLDGALSSPQKQAQTALRLLGAAPDPGLDLAWSQTPQAVALAATFIQALGPGAALGADCAKQAKTLLKAKCALTDAGWRALAQLADDPEFAYRAAHAIENAHAIQLAEEKMPSHWAALADGSLCDGPKAPLIHAVCKTASFCAGAGVDLRQAMAWAFPDWMGSDIYDGAPFSYLGINAPIPVRDVLAHVAGRPSHGHGARQAHQALWSAWQGLRERFGDPDCCFLHPGKVQEWSQRGWTPQDDAEREIVALDRDRLARQAKGFPLFFAILQQGAKAGFDSAEFKDDLQSVSDFLVQVELGFWEEQLPQKPSWSWIKRAADAWHDSVQSKRASTNSWEPLFGDASSHDLGERWIARELVDGAQLHREGNAMRHCVSTYADKCARGECRIFSLRSADGEFKSTIELQPHPQGGYREAQHRGFANSHPGVGAKLAASKLVAQINQRLAPARQATPS